MPRSTKAASKPSATKRRTTKRSTSEQPSCFDIPESPNCVTVSSVPRNGIDPSTQTLQAEIASSAVSSSRERSTNVVSSTAVEDPEVTPVQPRSRNIRNTTVELIQPIVPGLDALEAVNGLYTKLKESHLELETLRQEKEHMSTQNHALGSRISDLQAELKTEKDRAKKLASVSTQGKEAEVARKDAEERLTTIVEALKSFRSSALKIMPLLDVLTGAADIEYDEATERLYQIVKQYKDSEIDVKAK